MDGKNATCPTGWTRCEDKDARYCHGQGFCCETPRELLEICVCFKGYRGKYCHIPERTIARSEEAMRRAEAIAAFSAILGVVVILLFVALIFLQVKYYRQRKRRRAQSEHEMDRIPKPEDSGLKLPLRNEPGYSWRESARHSYSSKAYQTLKGPLSRSVPEDLFKLGIKIALFGMKGDEENKNEKRNPDALGRCFSADATSGGGGGGEAIATYQYTKLKETEENDNKENTVSDQKTEDTVK